MAEDEKRSRPPPSIPSLLAGRTSSADERESSRILAALEGRVPDAEAKHLSPKRRSNAPVLLLLLLLFIGAAGAGLWAVSGTQEVPDAVASAAPGTQAPAAAALSTATKPPLQAAAREADPAPAAAIIEDHPLAQLTQPDAGDTREPTNPLSALAVTAAAPKPATVAAAAPAKAPGPTLQRAEHAREHDAGGAPAAAPKASAARGKQAPRNDTDAALLAALMSYGLPPASPPGTKVYKTDGIFIRELPGSPLSARLEECRKLGFLESEQCRLRVCAGHWGTAAECPNAQAHVEP